MHSGFCDPSLGETVVSVASLCREEGAEDVRQERGGQEKEKHKSLFQILSFGKIIFLSLSSLYFYFFSFLKLN